MPPPTRAAARFAITYRESTDEDLPFLELLYASTRADEVAATGWPADMQRAFLAQQFAAQHRHYRAHYPTAEWLVIEAEGEVMGRLYVEEWPTQFRIIDISLVPEIRGRGLGAAILADVMDQAGAIGKRVSIHVEKNNPAMRLYLRLGFRPVEDKGVYDLLEWEPGHPVS